MSIHYHNLTPNHTLLIQVIHYLGAYDAMQMAHYKLTIIIIIIIAMIVKATGIYDTLIKHIYFDCW